MEQRISRIEAIELAESLKIFQMRFNEVETALLERGEKLAPGMQDQFCMGSLTIGIIPAGNFHAERVRSEVAFPVLA